MSMTGSTRRTLHLSKRQLVWLARAGYASRGVVYLIIALFALLAAIGAGRAQGSKGALEKLLSQPLGAVLIVALLVGLVGYVVWRLIQALGDADNHGTSPKGLAVRAGLLASAATYAALALYAASRIGILGGGGDGNGGLASALAGFVGSRWAATGLSLIFVGVGVAHWWKALTGKYARHFSASDAQMKLIGPVSVIGLCARGTIFFILAFLLFYRGLTAGEGGSTPGIEDALRFIQDLPLGNILLAAMAAGIAIFAVYSFCEAGWRKVDLEEGL